MNGAERARYARLEALDRIRATRDARGEKERAEHTLRLSTARSEGRKWAEEVVEKLVAAAGSEEAVYSRCATASWPSFPVSKLRGELLAFGEAAEALLEAEGFKVRRELDYRRERGQAEAWYFVTIEVSW